MKSFVSVVTLASTLFGFSAQAMRPLLPIKLGNAVAKADLVAQQQALPQADKITMYENSNLSELPVFSVVEDTGIRCIQAPCPSERTTLFVVQKVEEVDAQTTKYVAFERLANIPPFVRIAFRKLEVVESRGLQAQWDVLITNRLPGQDRRYIGYPEYFAAAE